MAKRDLPKVNTTSTADISFLMLTFFLLVSAINTDEGIQRRLPPMPKDKTDIPKVNERNVLNIKVNMFDQLLVNGVPMANVKELKNHTKQFMTNVSDDLNMPEKKPLPIPEFGGEILMQSKGIVSLQNDRGTSYKAYMAVQNELTEAFNELRDEFSKKKFGKTFATLDQLTKEGVQRLIPISISEAEPSNYGGN